VLCRRKRRFAAVLLASIAVACSSDSNDAAGTAPPRDSQRVAGAPDGWSTSSPSSFTVGLDHTEHHGGNSSVYLTGSSTFPTSSFANIYQPIVADSYRGKRVRWSGWVKQEGVSGTEAGLWMRVDGNGLDLAFDNMENRALVGTADWHQVSVVLDVPQSALGISVGVLSNAYGTLLVDDLVLEVVGNDVPSTSLLTNYPTSFDSASAAAFYSRASTSPLNVDFEGLKGPASTEVAWLASHAVELTTTDPTASLNDLAPLTQMVGNAHVVGMGEDTHGTRQFFQMKHRILEYLVTQLGFTYFAIEATTPESDDMNRYVLTGAGDPHVLLSNLYFWTWNTQEVFDMIQWMRQWNASAPVSKQVRFLGFDMQYPGAAIDSVTAFIARVDPGKSSDVGAAYACITPYRDVKGTFRTDPTLYGGLSAPTKAACASSLKSIYDIMNAGSATYTTATSPSEFQHALHAARLVQQFEMMETNSSAGPQARDRAMAENVQWIRDQAGPDARIALWAHNAHINAVPGAMGGYLHTAYGADYMPLGFAFGSGGFNAVGSSGLGPLQTAVIPPTSIEAVFSATGKSMLMLDTRLISGNDAAAPLAGPILMRSIGAVFTTGSDALYFNRQVFPGDFNVLIYLQSTSPSVLLPFVR
jgi:erythromycin esterase